MPGFISNSSLARKLIRIGDEAIAVEDGARRNSSERVPGWTEREMHDGPADF